MDKAAFVAKRKAKTREVETEIGTVTVRALTRNEVKELDKHKNSSDHDLRIIALGLVDPEGLTLDEVAEWASNAPVGEYMDVLRAINGLSGVDEEAAKSRVHGA